MSKAVFIDRDGTIGGSDKVLYPNDFTPYSFMEKAIKILKEENYAVYAFTNQPGISKGEITKEAFEQELKEYGFDQIYICPHQHEEGCECRKPSPFLLHKALSENKLAIEKCIVIGDRWTDMLAAHRVGIRKILVKTGAGQRAYDLYKQGAYFGEYLEVKPEFIAVDLLHAAEWIVRHPK